MVRHALEPDDGIQDVYACAPSSAGGSTWSFDVIGVAVADVPGDASHVILPRVSVHVALVIN